AGSEVALVGKLIRLGVVRRLEGLDEGLILRRIVQRAVVQGADHVQGSITLLVKNVLVHGVTCTDERELVFETELRVLQHKAYRITTGIESPDGIGVHLLDALQVRTI